MIRWSYLLPRLVALLVVMTSIHFGIPRLIRWTTVKSLELSTGTDVSVETAWASLARGEVRIGGVAVAHDQTSDTNLLQFDSASLDLDLNALSHRRCVVDKAEIRGLKFNVPRTSTPPGSSAIVIEELDESDVAQRAHRYTRDWLRQVAAMLEQGLEDEFESIRLTQQLSRRWPEEYRQLEQQALQLRQSTEQLYQAFTTLSSQSISMEQVASLQSRWADVVKLREDVADLQRRATHLVSQFQQDRADIDIALQHDHNNLREKMQLTQLRADQLSNLLLDGEVRRWWAQLKPWLELAHFLTDSPEYNEIGSRGRVVLFDNEPQPGFLIRNAVIDGQILLAGHALDFVGEACDLTLPRQPGSPRYDRPAQLKLVTRGPFEAQLYHRFDHIESAPRHQLILCCEKLPLPARHWGHDDSISLAVAPGTVKVQARLIVTDNRLDGRLRITQQGLDLVTRSAEPALQTMLEPVNTAVASLDRLDLHVDLTGTFNKPQWRLQSDLGRQLKEQLQVAARQIVREQADRMVTKADQRLRVELSQLQQQLATHEAALQQQLGVTSELLSKLAEPVTSQFSMQNLLQRF